MAISYNRLWHMLLDKKINKSQLVDLCGISPSTIARMSKDLPVSLDVIDRLCCYFKCDIENIVEVKNII